MDNNIFSTDVQEEIQGYGEQSEQAAQSISNERRKAAFFSCFFTMLGFFEYHFLYSVFRQVVGDDNPFWSPVIMGFTALTVVVAVHIMAMHNHHHPALRFIDTIASKMVPVYLAGIGLLLMTLLYKYGLGAMLDTDHAKLNIETMQMEGQSWVSWIFTYIASPLAALVFSAGLGALAICTSSEYFGHGA